MRKLREDITLVEYRATMEKKGYVVHPLIRQLTGAPGTPPVGVDWPDSFYEQPPVGSFGEAWNGEPKPLHPYWGELCKVDSGKYWLYSHDMPFNHFHPCLPYNVDEFGYPQP